jgi:glycosyltransferase involved in cell wall biosynthesis
VRVSVVLTAYNRSALLAASLAALSAQTLKDFEVIVVDDGNDDGETFRAVREAGARYIPTGRGEFEGWRNPAIACNVGFQEARGDVIVYQCGDIRFTNPQNLENLVFPVFQQTTSGARVVTMSPCKRLKQDGSFDRWHLHATHARQPLLGTGSAFEASLVRELGGFDERFTGWGYEDFDLMWRMERSGAKLMILSEEFVLTEHPWHEPAPRSRDLKESSELFERNKREIIAGRRGLLANDKIFTGVDSKT